MHRVLQSAAAVFCWVVLISSSPAPASGAGPATRPSALDALKPYIGDWRIDAAWSNGTPLKARATYAWGLNSSYIVCKTWVQTPDGGEYQRYETIFADKDGQIAMYNFDFMGEVHISDMKADGNKLTRQWSAPAGKDGSQTKLKQLTELMDDNHFRWQVWIQGAEGQWQPLMDGLWERSSASASASSEK